MEITVVEVEGVTVVVARLVADAGAEQVSELERQLPAGEVANLVIDLGPSPTLPGLADLLTDLASARQEADLPFAVVSARDAVREELRAAGVPLVFESLDIAVGDLAPASAHDTSPAEHDAALHLGLDARGD